MKNLSGYGLYMDTRNLSEGAVHQRMWVLEQTEMLFKTVQSNFHDFAFQETLSQYRYQYPLQ